MKRTLFTILCLLLLAGCEDAPAKKAELATASTPSNDSQLDREIKGILEKGTSISERKRQVPVIEATFERITTPDRARQLAALCFIKTLGTPFLPFDLAEIALAESGGHNLSARAVSPKGALGVWQLMPHRARSHGYSPLDMKSDEKCAEAAVRELFSKLEMAQGNLERAKRFYCGQGREADFYMRKIRKVRREMQAELARQNARLAMSEAETLIR
ncbi:transglycosylase SLT domain-containing protein [Geobacter sp. SVR]|uniref:transglycosylase SLT domain-containing protein n=1 Tax=Geobacter sp. SVR TaxID=2495594 RepID=UPI00143EFEF0|nr:transglycosylase SLT domain-containing protein [Geobacter sp. SVR]BCS52987.1 lytic transglycosylase [Geobacter sp. SVR]GCF84372.1 lytic transglycosylase [Geobacter sp. SVR]